MDRVLITGGSGTLGKAILRQARRERWGCQFTIYSRSESRQARMRAIFPEARYVLGDVRDYDRLESVVAGHDTVIHAAAMKRIPECEQYPQECYLTNIQGSINVRRAALRHRVQTCLGVSTDKACRAITVYGASKLALEGIFREEHEGVTAFPVIRYGNVVASTGSVIEMWKKLADEGKKIPITHPGMTRFWMSPTDAVNLLYSAIQRMGNDITVPMMKGIDLLTVASWIAPNSTTREVGLRSTEKFHEDLVHPLELSSRVGHHIYIGWGDLGAEYTSQTCPRLTQAEFEAMIADAADLEVLG